MSNKGDESGLLLDHEQPLAGTAAAIAATSLHHRDDEDDDDDEKIEPEPNAWNDPTPSGGGGRSYTSIDPNRLHCNADDDDNLFVAAADHSGFLSFLPGPVCRHAVVGGLAVISATFLVVLLPKFLFLVNGPADAYCGLAFVSVFAWLLLGLAVLVMKVWRRGRGPSLRPSLPARRVVKYGIYYGLSGLAAFYARDRFRVLCHLQDPLMAAVLPAAVMCHLFFSLKVDSVAKLVCIAAAIIGLFICIDFQIWDEYNCHGEQSPITAGDGQIWSSDERIIWTMVYLCGLGLLALFYTLLEKEIRIKMGFYSPLSINMPSYRGIANLALIEEQRPSTSDDVGMSSPIQNVQLLTSSSRMTFGHSLVLCMWIQLSAMLTILCLFWTDLFSSFGKAGSTLEFQRLMGDGFACLFGSDRDGFVNCGVLARVNWTFIVFYVLLFISVVYLVVLSDNCSTPYIVGVLTLALPISTIWWSFFASVDSFGWRPVFSGETGFTIVGFPIMAASLVLYKHYADREKIQIIVA